MQQRNRPLRSRTCTKVGCAECGCSRVPDSHEAGTAYIYKGDRGESELLNAARGCSGRGSGSSRVLDNMSAKKCASSGTPQFRLLCDCRPTMKIITKTCLPEVRTEVHPYVLRMHALEGHPMHLSMHMRTPTHICVYSCTRRYHPTI